MWLAILKLGNKAMEMENSPVTAQKLYCFITKVQYIA